MSIALKHHNSKGFTLVEMAIVLVIVGFFVGSLSAVYYNYEVRQKIQNTKELANTSVKGVGSFRAVHGRYPCPASSTAVPGDAAYGHEDQDCRDGTFGAAGTCKDGVCFAENDGKKIVIGTLPFKSMDLQEEEIYDSYGNKLLYAVTAPLTDETTFAMTGGGLNIVKEDGTSAVTPANSGHFIVVSSGQNGYGAYGRSGHVATDCASAVGDEQENCNNDGLFKIGTKNEGFDDTVSYFTPVDASYWKVTAFNSPDIHLRGGDDISVGFKVADDMSSAADRTAVKTDPLKPDSGIVWSESSYVLAQDYCNLNGTDPSNPADCFKPRLIMGDNDLLPDEIGAGGMKCPDDKKFMIGIKNSAPVCVDEVYMSCPSGRFISGTRYVNGVNATAGIYFVCDAMGGTPCPAQSIKTSCDNTRSLPKTFYGYTNTQFNGQCYRFATDYNKAYFDAKIATFDAPTAGDDLMAHVTTLNGEGRTLKECLSNPVTTADKTKWALVRDTFYCGPSGKWYAFPQAAVLPYPDGKPMGHERGNETTPDFTGAWSSTAQPSLAETGTDFNFEVGEDPLNISDNHDCWCREDYRASKVPCGTGYNGDAYVVEKHRCPQTNHQWTLVTKNTTNCVCVPAADVKEMTCAKYYELQDGKASGTYNDAVSGIVTYTQQYKCVDGVSVPDGGPSSPDVSKCACAAKGPKYDYTYCPTGWKNFFMFEETGMPLVNVASIKKTVWKCPDPKKPGHWESPVNVPDLPACTCGTKTTVNKACEAGLTGTGYIYEKEWDCDTGTWEPESEWTLLSKNCSTCSWRSAGSYELSNVGPGAPIFSKCNCGSAPALCHDNAPAGQYYLWTGCQCVKDD